MFIIHVPISIAQRQSAEMFSNGQRKILKKDFNIFCVNKKNISEASSASYGIEIDFIYIFFVFITCAQNKIIFRSFKIYKIYIEILNSPVYVLHV